MRRINLNREAVHMENKNDSGNSPLFPLYAEDMKFSQCLVLLTIVVAELVVMYIIQNFFDTTSLQPAGVIFLIISLIASFFGVVGYCRYIKNGKNKK